MEAPRPLGEESLQMWELNKRLEAYLARVKSLEEENEGLQSEIQRLKKGSSPGGGQDSGREEVAAWRAHLDEAFREKNAAELDRARLHEEVQRVQSRGQKEQAARQDAESLLALSKKELEEEKRSHLWLRGRAAQLEREREAARGAHEEERARLEQEVLAGFSWSLEGFRGAPAAAFQPLELLQDYSARLSRIWRGAVETYKAEVSQLEGSLGEAKETLWKATKSNRQKQLQLQSLQRELAALRGQKEALEERLAQHWQLQQGEAQKLQVAVEGLEEEKEALAAQIAQVLEDRRHLMHLKVSLSLEVATYRTLLEAESTRLQMSGDQKPALSIQDSKLAAASKSDGPAVSLERGLLGQPRGSTAFLKGGVTPQLARNQSGPFTANVASVLPKSRSPGGGEFQKANSVRQSQSAEAVEVVDVPAFIDSAAFRLGSSRQNEGMTASPAGTVSPSFIQESPLLFNSNRPLAPSALGGSSANAEQSYPLGEDSGDISAPMKIRELGKKAELHGDVDEGEKQPSEEPLWETPVHQGPHPSWLVTEALEIALQEVHLGDGRLLDAAGAPNGIPAEEDSSSMEEENNGEAASPSTAALEWHKSRAEDPPSAGPPVGIKGSEYSREANGDPEVCSEQHRETGRELSQDAQPSPPQGTQLLEEERSPSSQQSQEKLIYDIPVADTVGCCNQTMVSEQTRGGGQQPPNVQSIVQRGEVEECFAGTEPASPLDTEAAALWRGVRDSPEPGTSCAEDHPGATGPGLDKADGGAEDLDLEVVSTEALHLSEDEERRALSSPSRGSEEGDLQAEALEREFLQAEEFAAETLSPISHSFYSAGSHQGHHFLGVEQQAPEEETTLSKTDSALLEEEVKEADLEPETSTVGEAVLRDEQATDMLSAEPRALEEEAGVEEPRAWEPQDLLEEEDAWGKEDMMEKDEMATSQDWTWERQTVLQEENVERALRQEISTREQGKETAAVCQGDLPTEQQMEEEEIATKGEQEAVEVCQEDLPMELQMGEEEISTKGEQTVEACQGVLPVEEQVEKEEITTKGKKEEETVEGCQEDLPTEQQMEEEEITTKGEQEAVEVCQEDLPMELQMEEEEIATKGEQTVEACQGVLPVEEQVEKEEITTKGKKEEETVEGCQEDLPTEQQMEEEEITTKGEQGEETAEGYQGDLPTEQQMEEEGITTKGEQTAEAYQRVLPVEEQVEEEEITTKGKQEEETVEGCQEDLPTEQQMEEEEITTKGEQGEETAEGYQGDLPTEQQMEEEGITTKGEQTAEAYQRVLPVEEQVEEEEIFTKGKQEEETVEGCQEDLPMEHKMEEEEITTRGEQGEETAEGYQGDLPTEQQMEEEEITTKGEQTAEAYQRVLPVEEQVEEEEITTKGKQEEETVEECQEDLPTEQQMEEEEITTKGEQGEETAEGYQGDLPTEQQMEEEGITTKGEQTAEAYQRVLPMKEQVEEEEITTKGKQEVETVEGCQGDLAMERQMEEGGFPTASPERDMLNREDLTTEPEAAESEETESKISLEEKATETLGCVSRSDEQEEGNPEAKPVSGTDTLQAGEESVAAAAAAEREEADQTRQPWAYERSPPHGATTGAPPGAPSEAQDSTARGLEAESDRGPQEMAAESDHQLPRDRSGPDVSPNTTCEAEGTERERESSSGTELEETLPDHTLRHLHDGKMLAMTGKGQLAPEDEGEAEEPLLTGEGVTSAEAVEQAAEEEECPYSPQTENVGAEVLEDIGEERGYCAESVPQQDDSINSEELRFPKDSEEATTETLELLRDPEGGLHAGEAEMPGVGDSSPQCGAEVEQQLGEISNHGSGVAKEVACGEVALEETGSTEPVWEAERENVFQPDWPDPSYVQEGFQGGPDSPLDGSGPRHVVPEGPHKVSPLTSVADLGEIVLEEEQSPEGQKDGAGPEGLVHCEDERGPCVIHESQATSGLEEPAQPIDWPPLDSHDVECADPPSRRAEASLPADCLKDFDILGIVEQALEFNQGLIKAADQTTEAGHRAAQGEAENSGHSLALPDIGRSQVVPAETPSAPSPNGSSPLWVENNGTGPWQDCSLSEFATSEILNGIGGLPPAHGGPDVGSFREELTEEVAVGQPFPKRDLDDPSPPQTGNQDRPQTPAGGEAPRTGEISPQIHRNDSLEQRGQEGKSVEKSLFAHRMQAAHAKGKGAEMEEASIPPHFGEEILPLESTQCLTFRPDEEEESWSPEDN